MLTSAPISRDIFEIPPPGVIRRERDPALINQLSNRETIRSVVSRHGGPLKWDDAVRACVILSNGEDAIQVYEQTADRAWQVVTMFDETCRGKRALEAGLGMRQWMEPYADLIFGSVPNNLPHALWFYRQLGGYVVDSIDIGGETYVAQEDETLLAFRVAH